LNFLIDTVINAITQFFANILDELINFFASTLVNIMSTSLNVLQLPLVKNGILYSQGLAFTILVLKSANEAFQTYILYQNGDPDSDPEGLVIRTAQAVAIIATLPWIVTQIFTFGTKVALDISNLSTGQAGIQDWAFITTLISANPGVVIPIILIAIVVMLLIVGIQATIRGAELALVSILGPIMALNLTANNRSIWSAWLRQTIIICTTQGLQIFMLKGALSLLTNNVLSNNGILLVFGWLWVTIKTPKFVQQFAYSTGLTSSIVGGARQTGSFYVMRKMLTVK